VEMPTGEELTIEGERITPDHKTIIEPDGTIVPNDVVLAASEE
jgi:hypothetical protein